jgi:hypothetical protein
MKTHIGIKLVNLAPMTRGEYNAFRGWTPPAGETQDDPGYLVEYLDGGKPNVDGFPGYVSWTPKEQADAAYRPTDGMPFGLAIEALKKGKRVARVGWSGQGQFVYLVPPASYPVQTGAAKAHFGEGAMVPYNAYFALKGVDDTVSTWAPSVSDSLADDWQIVEDVRTGPVRPTFQQRVLDEKTGLDKKASALAAFFSTAIFAGLPEAERARMSSQHCAMTQYSSILGDRIAAFE